MSGNTFGSFLRLTTFGESHGPALGMVLDGFPPGIRLDMERVRAELARRAPGRDLRSKRMEPEEPEPLSGLLDGQSTGAPLAVLLRNKDARPGDYDELARLLRPGHAGFGFRARYGIFDHRGGGRASGRETAARVLGGALARQALEALLLPDSLQVLAFVDRVGKLAMPVLEEAELLALLHACHPDSYPGPVPCPRPDAARAMEEEIRQARSDGDSLGGVVRCLVIGVPAGLGDPVFDKLHALLGHAMLSIGAVRGVEFGMGFAAARMRGSEHNDPFETDPQGHTRPASNRAGGIQGGISTGLTIDFRVAVKPTASIALPQQTVDLDGRPEVLRTRGRHDPCIALRIPPVVEAMTCLVLLDLLIATSAAR